VVERLPQFTKDRYVAMPAGIKDELPAGIALDLLLIDIQQSLKHSPTPFSIRPKHFDLPLDEALAVVKLSEQGYSDTAAWWLAREASVSACVELISDVTPQT
jgi:hypothetical protein